MKTRTFVIWTNLVEKLLQDIATEKTSYADLATWMEKEGAQQFRTAQGVHFNQHKAEYLQDTDCYPPPVKINLAYAQLQYGFNEVFKALLINFPALPESTNTKFALFLTEALSARFLPVLATRAAIALNTLLLNEPDRSKIFDYVIDENQLVSDAAAATIAAMQEVQPKPSLAAVSVARDATSSVLYKTPQTDQVSRTTTENPNNLTKGFQ